MIHSSEWLQAQSSTASGAKSTSTTGGSTVDRQAWQREMEREQSASWFKPWVPPPGHAAGLRAPVSQQSSDATVRRAPEGRTVIGADAASQTARDRPTANSESAATGAHVTAEDCRGADGAATRLPRRDDSLAGSPAAPSKLCPMEAVASSGLFEQPPIDAHRAVLAQATHAQPAAPWVSSMGASTSNADAIDTNAPAPRAVGNPDQQVRNAVHAACGPNEPVRLHVQWEGDAARIWLGLDAGGLGRLPELTQALSHWLGGLGLRLRSIVCNGRTWLDRGEPALDTSTPGRRNAMATPTAGTIAFIDIVAERES
jgi:hypothetical protein